MDTNIDINEITQVINAGKEGVNFLKGALSLISDDKKRKEAQAQLIKLETALEIQYAQAALTFGYKLCMRHFPPAPMVENEHSLICEKCNAEEKLDRVISDKEMISSLEKEILLLLYDHQNKNRSEVPETDLAAALNKPLAIVQVALEDLYNKEYVHDVLIVNSDPLYYITTSGTRYLLSKNLV